MFHLFDFAGCFDHIRGITDVDPGNLMFFGELQPTSIARYSHLSDYRVKYSVKITVPAVFVHLDLFVRESLAIVVGSKFRISSSS